MTVLRLRAEIISDKGPRRIVDYNGKEGITSYLSITVPPCTYTFYSSLLAHGRENMMLDLQLVLHHT